MMLLCSSEELDPVCRYKLFLAHLRGFAKATGKTPNSWQMQGQPNHGFSSLLCSVPVSCHQRLPWLWAN